MPWQTTECFSHAGCAAFADDQIANPAIGTGDQRVGDMTDHGSIPVCHRHSIQAYSGKEAFARGIFAPHLFSA